MEKGKGTSLHYSAVGTTWELEEAEGTPAYTEVSNIEEIAPPVVTIDDIETSVMDSTNQFKTFEAGWKDSGEVTLSRQYDEDEQATLWALKGTSKGWGIVFDSGSQVAFNGYIKGFGNPVNREGKVMHDLTIKVSGPPTYFKTGDAGKLSIS